MCGSARGQGWKEVESFYRIQPNQDAEMELECVLMHPFGSIPSARPRIDKSLVTSVQRVGQELWGWKLVTDGCRHYSIFDDTDKVDAGQVRASENPAHVLNWMFNKQPYYNYASQIVFQQTTLLCISNRLSTNNLIMHLKSYFNNEQPYYAWKRTGKTYSSMDDDERKDRPNQQFRQ